MLTYTEAYKKGIYLLEKGGYANAKLDALVILLNTANISKEYFYAYGINEFVPEDILEEYEHFIRLRLGRMPVSYIVGHREFMNLDFYVNRSVLIPRPSTETLVEEILKRANKNKGEQIVADIGTGSGCIAISLAYYNRDIKVYAGDISLDALKVARFNIDKIHRDNFQKNIFFRIHLFHGDLLSSIPEELKGKFNFVVSNPPYVTSDEWKGLMDGVKNFEPLCALIPEEGVLNIYKGLALGSMEYLAVGGFIAVEIGSTQSSIVSKIFEEIGFRDIYTYKDLEGFDRVVIGKK